MNRRITNKDLEQLCRILNNLTHSPQEEYTKTAEGNYIANVGNWHLDFAYGGVSLERTINQGGGVTQPLSTGHISKPALYDKIQSFIAGMEFVYAEMENNKMINAYTQGYKAYKSGLLESKNPYIKNSDNFWEWIFGYSAAKQGF